jgi:hypothetical protein
MKTTLLFAACALALAGCAERDQTSTGIKSDQQPFAGTAKQPPFMAAGWKAGDRADWEAKLKVRTVNGQNEHGKMP